MKTHIDVAVVDCEVPLLISTSQLKKWNTIQDYANDKVEIGLTGEIIQLKKLESGHLGIHLLRDDHEAECEHCFLV